MSNNARVVVGGEIGSAQYFQALAAGVVPDVRMNPVLLKPETDTRSQVVLMGQVEAALSRLDWRSRSAYVWPTVCEALDALIATHDLVVIEGAGSPAEINLRDTDYVNMRVALHAQAACLLVTDIDRGGSFAHLYGTWALLPPQEQACLRGFVLNRSRGDPALLPPGPQMLQERTGIPTLATHAQAAFRRLASRHELIVVEGAGSPAEINLAAHDYVNLGTARWARCGGPWQGCTTGAHLRVPSLRM